MTSRTLKTFNVRFCVVDWYSIEVKATGPDKAIVKAQALYERHGEDEAIGFGFDISQGGDDNWSAEEVQS